MEPKLTANCDVSFDQIARKLLKERLHLTALELFAELTENGKDLPFILKDYINSFNDYELNSTFLERSNSLQTFDSLDLTRSSDDGEKSWEQIAVLEFELRKAKETINNLRETLTYNLINSTDIKNNFKDKSDSKLNNYISTQLIKPQEKRAINYLINGYLLKQNYKLTSITFSEENEDQDFDDWLDVGLNITEPPDLLYFYRFFWFYSNQLQNKSNNDQSQNDIQCKTQSEALIQPFLNLQVKNENEPSQNILLKNDSSQKHQVKIQDQIKKATDHFEKDYDHEKEVLNSKQEKPSLSFAKNNQVFKIDKNIQTDFKLPFNSNLLKSKVSSNNSKKIDFNCDANCNEADVTKFEINLTSLKKLFLSLDFLKNLDTSEEKIFNNDNKIAILLLTQHLPQIISNLPSSKRCESFPLLIVAILFNQSKSNQSQLLKLFYTVIKKPNKDERKMISTGLVCLASHLNGDIILSELFSNFLEDIESSTVERRLLVVECISSLNSFASVQVRSSILLSLLRSLVQDHELEVKKLSCNSLANSISLFFENGQFDKITEIISTFFLAIETIQDQNEKEGCADFFKAFSNNLLLPIAFWSFKSNNFKDVFLTQLTSKLINCFEDEYKRVTFFQLLTCFDTILPFIFAFVIKDAPSNSSTESISFHDFHNFKTFLNQSYDLKNLITDQQIESYLSHINKEWFKTWSSLNWIVDNICDTFLFRIITRLKLDINIIDCMIDIFKKIGHFLGVSLTRIKLKNLFLKHLKVYDSNDDIFDSFTNSVLPIYFNAIFLSHPNIFQDVEEVREMTKCFQIGLMNVSLFNYSLVSFETTIAIVTDTKSSEGVNFLISFLRESFTNSNPFIRRNVSNLYKNLIERNEKLNLISNDSLIDSLLPSLIALLTDVDLQVRASAISAFGSLLSMIRYRVSCNPNFSHKCIEIAQTQLQTCFDDQINRDQHLIQLELIKMVSKFTLSIDSSQNDFDLFFIRFVIPNLSAFAAQTAQLNASQRLKKQDILLALLETYVSISKISNQVLIDHSIEEAILPVLKCIKDQLVQVAPDYKEASILLINEFERRANLDNLNLLVASNSKSINHSNMASTFNLINSTPCSNTSLSSSIIHNQMVDDVKSRVKGILNRSTSISTAAKTNIANIFKRN